MDTFQSKPQGSLPEKNENIDYWLLRPSDHLWFFTHLSQADKEGKGKNIFPASDGAQAWFSSTDECEW